MTQRESEAAQARSDDRSLSSAWPGARAHGNQTYYRARRAHISIQGDAWDPVFKVTFIDVSAKPNK